MKVNYVLMYGIPYVRYKEFETFEDISKFLICHHYVDYSIFKKLEDKEEIEMIYRDNDIHYLENFVKEQDKEIERLNKCYCERTDCSGRIKNSKKYESVQEENKRLHSIIKEVRKYIKERTEFGEYTYAYPGVLNQDEVREINRILDKENK